MLSIMKPAAVSIIVFTSVQLVKMDSYSGHLQPLGYHQPPSGGVTMTGMFPEPAVFFENFIAEGQPLLMRKALTSFEFPAFNKWTDHYLREYYGDEVVEVEEGKKEDREQPLDKMKLKEFLDVYKQEDLYMVHTLPESMNDDISVPVTLQCGGFQKVLQELVIWFSSGGTKSVLHSDSLDNINCLLDGTKDIIFIDKKYGYLVEADGFNEEKSYSTVDVDRVDLLKFPKLREVPWLKATLQKGDCIYIPYRWYHQVNSHGPRNLAVNFWFSHLWWLNKSDCSSKDLLSEPVPLRHMNVSSSNEFPRSQFLEMFSDFKYITRTEFLKELGLDGDKRDVEFFKFIDENKDGVLSWEELYTFSIDDVIRKFPDILGLTEKTEFTNMDNSNSENVRMTETKDENLKENKDEL